jgi:hypothetical protein
MNSKDKIINKAQDVSKILRGYMQKISNSI